MLYGFSSHVVPVPKDYPAHAHVTGYWFLDEPEIWHPPTELWTSRGRGSPGLHRVRQHGIWKHAQTRGQIVVGAVEKARVRAVVATGWGGPKWARRPTVCTSSKQSRTPGCPRTVGGFTMAEQARQLLACWRLVPLSSVPCWVIRASGRSG